jgi:antitoxin MazE
MKVKVAKWGNSLAVRLPKPLAEDLGLAPGREVELRQNGTRLTMETATRRKIPTYRLEDLLAQIKPGQKPPALEEWGILETEWPADDWSDVAPTDEEWTAWKKEAELKPKSKPKRGRQRAVPSRRRS